MKVVGLDIGRSSVKLCSDHTFITFPSVVGEWRERKLKNESTGDEYEVVYKGERYFIGSLALQESEFYRQMLIDDKATTDAKVLALTSLFLLDEKEVDIVTGLPINQHDNKNKRNLINLLQGEHEIMVNGVTRSVDIKRVRVSVEGGGAFWSNPREGLLRIVDGGSKTINYITMLNKRYIDRDSGTLPFGLETNKTTDIKHMVARIVGELGKKWSHKDTILVVGGRAKELSEELSLYFPNADTLNNKRSFVGNKELDLNLFANAIGYYNIGRTV